MGLSKASDRVSDNSAEQFRRNFSVREKIFQAADKIKEVFDFQSKKIYKEFRLKELNFSRIQS